MSTEPDATEIEILLFASLRETTGRDRLVVSVPAPCSARELLERVGAAEPGIRDALSAVRVAVDHRFLDPEDPVSATGEIALIPPVSGG